MTVASAISLARAILFNMDHASDTTIVRTVELRDILKEFLIQVSSHQPIEESAQKAVTGVTVQMQEEAEFARSNWQSESETQASAMLNNK